MDAGDAFVGYLAEDFDVISEAVSVHGRNHIRSIS